MTEMTLPNDFEIQAELQELDADVTASELHGLLTGWLSAGGKVGKDWLQKLMLDTDLQNPDEQSQLDAMLKTTQKQLKDPEFGFALMIPDDSESLTDRVERMFEWCGGFVAGFGLGGGNEDELSAEGKEALADLVTISKSSLADEPDEDSFAEIQEYVRVAALLLHGDVAMAKDYRNSLN